jgi:hypothetical protein
VAITLARATRTDGSSSGTLEFECDGYAALASRTMFAKRKAPSSALGGRAKPLKMIKATAGQSHTRILVFARVCVLMRLAGRCFSVSGSPATLTMLSFAWAAQCKTPDRQLVRKSHIHRSTLLVLYDIGRTVVAWYAVYRSSSRRGVGRRMRQ